MKQYKYILYCLAVLFGACLFTGCANDEMIKGEEERATEKPLLTIVAGVSETAGTRADDPTKDEKNKNGSWIESMTIFLFKPGAGDNDIPLFVKTTKIDGIVSMTNQIKAVELTGTELSNAKISLGTNVDIYAITNHIPTNAALLTKKEIMKVTGTLPIYNNIVNGVQPLVPMSGVALKYIITSESNQQTNISLQRAVIRVEIIVVDHDYDYDLIEGGKQSLGILKVNLYNDYFKTYLWNAGIPDTPDCRKETDAITKDFGVAFYEMPQYELGTFYLNCNESTVANPVSTNKITVQMECDIFEIPPSDHIKYTYTIELKRPDGTYNFDRNTSLKVTITLKAKGYATNVEVVPWDVDTESPELDPI